MRFCKTNFSHSFAQVQAGKRSILQNELQIRKCPLSYLRAAGATVILPVADG